jgi:hypothetical protein
MNSTLTNFCFFCFLIISLNSFSQENEHTDSTIVKIVNPEKQLKLWYGSEDFPISDFVVLPKYTILYNQEMGKLRLLENSERLVVDEYNINSIKKIMLINGTNRTGQKIKYPLGPINAWFTIEDDTTVLAGTITIKKSEYGSRYIRIAIRNSKLHIETVPFLEVKNKNQKTLTQKTSYITSLYKIKNQEIIVTPFGFLNKEENNKSLESSSDIYLRDKEGGLKNIYSIENSNSKLLNPIQIITTNQFILFYDTTIDVVKIFNHEMKHLSDVNLNSIRELKEKPKRFFGKSFFWDAFNNQLYYRLIYEDNNKNARTFYKVDISQHLQFQKQLVLYTVGYTEKYINYGAIFSLRSQNRYIYTVPLEER